LSTKRKNKERGEWTSSRRMICTYNDSKLACKYKDCIMWPK